MWHQSRDNPRRQWNETSGLALGTVVIVLRSVMPCLAVRWEKGGHPLFFNLADGVSNGLQR